MKHIESRNLNLDLIRCVALQVPGLQKREYTLAQAIPAGFKYTIDMVTGYVRDLKLVATPSTGAYKSVGSFIAIGQVFPSTWNWLIFMNLLALLSIMLGVMNLIPIPGLDGGHMLFVLCEMITGKKPGDKFNFVNCHNSGDVISNSYGVGGFAGNLLGSATNCYNTGEVESDGYGVGGFAGLLRNAVVNGCFNVGNVTSNSTITDGSHGNAGGLSGEGYGEVGARSHGLGCHIGVVNAAHGINVELECACPRANGLGEGGGACGRCGNYRTGNIEVA